MEFEICEGVDRLILSPPITTSWHIGTTKCSTKQFPIQVAFAITIHKAQGLTVEKVSVRLILVTEKFLSV